MTINYKGSSIPVKGWPFTNPMNRCLFLEIDAIDGYEILAESTYDISTKTTVYKLFAINK